MRPNLSLQIPEDALDDFRIFLSAPLEALDKLTVCLKSADPTPDVEELAAYCNKATQIPTETIEGILTLLLNLSRLRRSIDRDAPDLLLLIEQALSHYDAEVWAEQQSAWRERRNALEALLSADGAIEAMSKVRELLYGFQSLYWKSNVLTDIRYIYDNAVTRPLGAVVLQTLALDYLEHQERRQLHLALTADEIQKMIAQLERAQRKAEVSLRLLEEHAIPELTPKTNLS